MKYKTLMLSAVIATTAAATDAPKEWSDSLMSLAEVEVTAIKEGGTGGRDRASTVVGAVALQRYDVASMKQVSEMVPNFYVPQYGSQVTSSIYVRGLGARIDQPAVGMAVDNVALLNKNNFDFDMADIEKIEVIRGPQNVLFGRNTMAGQVNVTTLSPLHFQGLRFMAEYASARSAKVSGGIYGKPAESVAMSASVYGTRTDGHFRNTYNNSRVGAQRQVSGRWRTIWTPSERLAVDNVTSASWARQSGYPYRSVDLDAIAYNDTCFYRRTAFTDGLTIKAEVGNVRLSSVSTFQWLDDNVTLDQDFLPQDYFTLTQRQREWGVTQDIVAAWTCGALTNVGGLYGFYRRTRMSAPVTFKDTGIAELIEGHRNENNPSYPIRWDTREFLLGSDFVMPLWGLSAYDEASVSIGRWTLTAALRLDYERTAIRFHSHTDTGFDILDCTGPEPTLLRHDDVSIDDRGHLAKSSLQLLPKFSVGYEIPGTANFYASVSKGVKSGGYNTQMFSDVLQQRLMSTMGISDNRDVDEVINYRPEKSWNYEAGAHLSLLDGALTADAALFYIDVRDQQLTVFPDGTTTGRMMANAGHTRSRGVELAVTGRPASGLALRASWGFTDATFVNFFDGRQDHSGNRVPYAPRHTLFCGADYTLRPAAARFLDAIDFSIDCRAAGPIEWNEANTLRQPFYALLGASVTLRRGTNSLSLWGRNLTNTRYATFHFVSISHPFLQEGAPLAIGATLRLSLPK